MWWIKDKVETANLVMFFITATLIYCVGIYQHSKIIKVCQKEKEMTWKLDITNSILLLVHFGHKLLLHGVTFLVPDLSIYTGDWLCYVSKFITYYLSLYTTTHSFVVSILKYVLIVHWRTSQDIGKDKIKDSFFYINFLHPFLTISLHLILRPDFFYVYDGYAQIDRCLGDPNNHWNENIYRPQTKLHNICSFPSQSNELDTEFMLQITKWGACWIQVIILYLISFNIFEIIVYFRVFWCMRRQIDPSNNNAARSLNDAQNSINKRRVHINAQVTAMISCLEMFGNVTVIILLAITKGTSLLSLMHGMIFYAVLIPRTFLMNTSHNKDRIIEMGWKYIMINLIGKPNNRVRGISMDPREEELSPKTKLKKKQATGNNNEIFIVESSIKLSSESSKDPSSSEGTSHGIVLVEETGPDRNQEKLDVQDSVEDTEDYEIMNKLILRMLTEVRDELCYISNFKQLITYIDYKERGKIVSLHDLEYEFLNKCKEKNQNIAKQKIKGKRMSNVTSSTLCGLPNKLDIDLSEDTVDASKGNCGIEMKDIVSKRSRILSELFVSLNKKESYDTFINQLIDLEENFIHSQHL